MYVCTREYATRRASSRRLSIDPRAPVQVRGWTFARVRAGGSERGEREFEVAGWCATAGGGGASRGDFLPRKRGRESSFCIYDAKVMLRRQTSIEMSLKFYGIIIFLYRKYNQFFRFNLFRVFQYLYSFFILFFDNNNHPSSHSFFPKPPFPSWYSKKETHFQSHLRNYPILRKSLSLYPGSPRARLLIARRYTPLSHLMTRRSAAAATCALGNWSARASLDHHHLSPPLLPLLRETPTRYYHRECNTMTARIIVIDKRTSLSLSPRFCGIFVYI